MSSIALESPYLLLSYYVITLSSHNTIILIIAYPYINLYNFQPINQNVHRYETEVLGVDVQGRAGQILVLLQGSDYAYSDKKNSGENSGKNIGIGKKKTMTDMPNVVPILSANVLMPASEMFDAV